MNVVKHVHPIVQPQLEDCTLYLGITEVKPMMQIQKSSGALDPSSQLSKDLTLEGRLMILL